VTVNSHTLTLTENGGPVTHLIVSPLSNASQLGVVLVIDTSNSMHGARIASAISAARTFASHRIPEQPLSIVVFNNKPTVLLPFTTDQKKIDAALASPPTLAAGTHILDAVDTAEQEISAAQLSEASIVVLSDGSDTGSSTSLADVTNAAVAAHTRVFTVGLESSNKGADALSALATAGGGRFTEAHSAAELSSIYDDLGAELANQYLVTYDSLAPANAHVTVTVSVAGVAGQQTASYTSPALSTVKSAPYHRTAWAEFVGSWLGAVAIAGIAAALFAAAIILIVQPRRRRFRHRMRQFVPETGETQTDAAVTDALYEKTERILEGTRWWDRFSEDVELAHIGLSAAQAIVLGLVGGVLLGVGLAALTGAPVMLIFSPLVPIVGRVIISIRADRQRFAFATQLPDNLQVLASALRAGHSFVGALAVMTDDSAEPSRSEFRRLLAEERVGIPVDQSLAEISRRMESREVMQIALVTVVQQQTGGNTAEILDQVAANVRARFELKRLIRTLTAQGRVSRWVVTALPIFLFAVIFALNPGYVAPLIHTAAGQLLVVISAVMTVTGSYAIGKIVQIDI
jgi:tight adherence protein B